MTSQYISKRLVEEALTELKSVHPFFGITYLAYKEMPLPVGRTKSTRGVEKAFLDRYFRPVEEYPGYFQPFKSTEKTKVWLRPRYPDTGLQSIRTQNIWASRALIHIPRSEDFGWKENYVEILKSGLRGKRIPAFYLAAWLYYQREWPQDARAEDVLQVFQDQFHITDKESHALFDMTVPKTAEEGTFSTEPFGWKDLKRIVGDYPGAPLESGGALQLLRLESVGPADDISFEPSERLNIVAGDNGLGKTFLLDCAWWALSGSWPQRPATPRFGTRKQSKITFEIGSPSQSQTISIPYDYKLTRWSEGPRRKIVPALLLYARFDNSFAIFDPASWAPEEGTTFHGTVNYPSHGPLVLSEEEVWDGSTRDRNGKRQVVCNGLIRDWVSWQNHPDDEPFRSFRMALRSMSPVHWPSLEPGTPVRVPLDAREIPTVKHPYGEVSVLDVSAGVRRIIALAYLMVWAWNEHCNAAKLRRVNPQRRMVILIDEMEAHLHPQWQRTIVPAIMDVAKELTSAVSIQTIVATHSPLVMVSTEPYFNSDKDKLFHLDVRDGHVVLDERKFVRQGVVDGWLRSDVFGLKHPRSLAGESAIEEAKAIQLKSDPTKEEVSVAMEKLKQNLSETDEFWPRWIYFARKHGVEI